MSQTITENLALLRQHVRALEERAEAAEGKLDIIKRRLEGEPDDSLAIDYGGTGWGSDPVVLAVAALQQANVTVGRMVGGVKIESPEGGAVDNTCQSQSPSPSAQEIEEYNEAETLP